MTKPQIIAQTALATGISQAFVEKVYNVLLGREGVLFLSILDGPTNLGDLGVLKLKEQAARQARNPATGETIQVPAKRKLTLSPSKAIRDSLNPAKR